MSDQLENPELEPAKITENGENSDPQPAEKETDSKKAKLLPAETAEKETEKETAKKEKPEAKKTEKKEEEEEKKVKKTPSLPKAQLSIAQLGQKVSVSWPLYFPNLNVPNTDARTLAQDAADMLQLIRETNSGNSKKLQNTADLVDINALINTGANALKAAIKLHNPTVKKLSTIYAAYGLETTKPNYNKFPADNATRSESLLALINQLQTPNNPIVNSLQTPFTLADWINLQQRHANLWSESENLRQLRSNNTNEIAKLHEKIKTQLKRVYQYMTGVYSREELPRKKRLMGFLKESF